MLREDKKRTDFTSIIQRCGLSRDEYETIVPMIRAQNMNTMRWLSLVLSLMMLALVVITFLPVFESLAKNRVAYLAMGMISAVFLISAMTILPARPTLVFPVQYAFFVCIIAFAIYIGVFTNNEARSSTILVLLLAMPLLIIDRPARISLLQIAACTASCVASYHLKVYDIFMNDSINAAVMLVISIVVTFSYQLSRHRDMWNRHLIELEHARQLELKEIQHDRDQALLTLGQLKPHFMYNTLLCIQELCHEDACQAEEAIMEFSLYLRGNLDSLHSRGLVPFEHELRLTENYLSLEKKRFGERLNIEWDLQVTSFSLPPLTLQPIVENAVQHGVTKRRKGGTVTISTIEEDDRYVLTVADDGVGFDVGKPPDESRTHVGFEMTCKRVENMMGGSLDLQSVPDQGTSVAIRIPKEGHER